ncbi:MAG: protein-L-isoaspartate(D-aspartate) O-methyltransferase [Candidatus Nanoarchaeia archaeon]|nr:protein-L-isoaspartate(D-aspartate) O-methyltransferase [Candidatus Nanoarchaeia archaeon]
MERKELVDCWNSKGIVKDKRLLDAFLSVPREKFILDGHLSEAYGDYPLPILEGQTISQPTTVMIMINALELKKTDKVLEVGAGSGYCAAIISRIAKEVYTTEIIPGLVDFAKKNLEKAGIKNVYVIHHDGSQGYEKESFYDKIIVTAACPKIPQPLIDQLKENGMIIAPVSYLLGQKIVKGIKKQNKLEKEPLGDFAFVPLKGKYGY